MGRCPRAPTHQWPHASLGDVPSRTPVRVAITLIIKRACQQEPLPSGACRGPIQNMTALMQLVLVSRTADVQLKNPRLWGVVPPPCRMCSVEVGGYLVGS